MAKDTTTQQAEAATEETPPDVGAQPTDPNASGSATATSTQDGSSASQEPAGTGTEEEAFDPSVLESQFGLPSGMLKDTTDAESALEAIRQYADSTLTAGLSHPGSPTQTKPPAETKPETKPDGGKQGSGNAEIDALRAELVEVKSVLTQQQQAAQHAQMAEIQRRMDAEIDNWSSPKYGKGTARNFNQSKATQELRDLVGTHVAGMQATGRPIPTVEAIMRQVRAFHDADYKPSASAQQKAQAPLGTPGAASKQIKADGAPRNIHEALAQNFS